LNSLSGNVPKGANVHTSTCISQSYQQWVLNSTDETFRNKHTGLCVTTQQELEVWADPLSDGSQAVVLLNRGNIGSEPITVQWTDIGFPGDKAANVRDLWARKDLGTFTGNFTSPNIDAHSVMMLKITPSK
jgi:hypothetical protein